MFYDINGTAEQAAEKAEYECFMPPARSRLASINKMFRRWPEGQLYPNSTERGFSAACETMPFKTWTIRVSLSTSPMWFRPGFTCSYLILVAVRSAEAASTAQRDSYPYQRQTKKHGAQSGDVG